MMVLPSILLWLAREGQYAILLQLGDLGQVAPEISLISLFSIVFQIFDLIRPCYGSFLQIGVLVFGP